MASTERFHEFWRTSVPIAGDFPVITTAAVEWWTCPTTDAPDLRKEPTLYVVGYAHLDTEWRWEYPQVISEYLRKTMEDNFRLLDKYTHYVFNFSGANRYRLMKEYFRRISRS